MAKYKIGYRCLSCNKLIFGKGLPEQLPRPIELSEDQVTNMCAAAANPTFKHEKLRTRIPSVLSHDCFGDGRQVGAAIFAGFGLVKEEEKE